MQRSSLISTFFVGDAHVVRLYANAMRVDCVLRSCLGVPFTLDFALKVLFPQTSLYFKCCKGSLITGSDPDVFFTIKRG
jgi:hypothetical protein